jgi:hypothetical protein
MLHGLACGYLEERQLTLAQRTISYTTALRSGRLRWLDNSLLRYASIFLVSFIILFLGMNRGFDVYDEGLILVGAMRVAAGQVPHRDFYANYGPGQFYILAWLFDWFGRSILVERIYDLTLRAGIVTAAYGITRHYCRRWIVVSTTIVCGFWLFSSGLPTIAYPIIPALLLSLVGSILLLRVFQQKVAWQPMVAAGALTGAVALFRYDVGAALMLVQTCSIGIAALMEHTRTPDRWRAATSAMAPYWLGITAIFLPVALLYLAVAPIQPFIHDIFLYPTKYYVRARRLPFPGLHWRSLENIALYLPVPVGALSLYSVFAHNLGRLSAPTDQGGLQNDKSQAGLLVLFGLLTVAFYFKGLVRISVLQMLLALIPMVITLAVLYEYSSRRGRVLHRIVQFAMVLSIFSATWSALKEVRLLHMYKASVLQEMLSPRETGWCGVPNPLHKGLCFWVDPNFAQVISYLPQHTSPGEKIFVGLIHHDRILFNDLLTYFAVSRLPATHWSHFDPDLQTRSDIQMQMIHELDSQAVRYIVLESQFDKLSEPSNDSAQRSGVTLLDDYIRNNYHVVAAFGGSSVWLRNGARP